MNTLAWLDVYAKKIGYAVGEYNCMPIGMLQDHISIYLATEGLVDLRPPINNRNTIPRELR